MQSSGSRSGCFDQPSNFVAKAPRKLKSPASDAGDKHRGAEGAERKVSSEKQNKKISKDTEMESQLADLQDELKKAKEQLRWSETLKARYQREVEEAKRKLSAMSVKLEYTEQQLDELSKSEEDRVQELCKIAHDRDKAWQSELDAVKQQQLMTSTALASAMNEMNRLKIQLGKAPQLEARQAAEVHSLRNELRETLLLAEDLKLQLNSARQSEALVMKDLRLVQRENEAIRTSEETLKLKLAKALESHNALLLELEESKNKLIPSENARNSLRRGEEDESEISVLKSEVRRLRAAVKEAEMKYQNECMHSTLEIRNAYQMLEEMKSAYRSEESESRAKLNQSMAEVEELRKMLAAMGINGQRLDQEANRESELVEKDMEMQRMSDENEKLKSEISKTKNDQSNAKESLVELNSSFGQADLLIKELDAARASKAQVEAELGRIKVQCDQWRKAAEAAAAMLTAGDNEKYGGEELGNMMSSSMPLEDTEDDSPKKRNTNMLKKIGVLLRKGQK